jgi:hypothetical protein
MGLNAIKQKDFKWFQDMQGSFNNSGDPRVASNPFIEATNPEWLFIGNEWDGRITAVKHELVLGKSYYILVVKTIVKKRFDEETNEVVVTRTDKMVCVRSIKTGEIAKLNLSASK